MSNHSKYPNLAGIYKLMCINNGKIYIGKAINIRQRINSHKCSGNKSTSKWYLQNAIIKHGWDSFTVEILETVENFDKLKDNDSLLERESSYIKLFDSTNPDKGYNRCKYSKDNTGRVLTEEHKEKIRQANLGKKRSEESKANMRKPKSEDYKEKMRLRTHSEESKANMRTPKSDEHKENMRKVQLGKSHTQETKDKLRQRVYSIETREKMRQAKLGKTHSEETKQKMKQSRQRELIKTEA